MNDRITTGILLLTVLKLGNSKHLASQSTAIIARKVPANARNVKSVFRFLLPPFSAKVREQLKKL